MIRPAPILLALAPGLSPAPSPPVTLADLDAAWRRVDGAAADVLGVPSLPGEALDAPSRPATRADLVERLDRSLARFRPKFRSKPRAIPVDRRAIDKRNAPTIRPALTRLVEWGFVPPTGPLVVGPRSELTAEEAGDALGLFLARLAELTHRPSSRFSPDLMPDGSALSSHLPILNP